jgi:hypothetical protein
MRNFTNILVGNSVRQITLGYNLARKMISKRV